MIASIDRNSKAKRSRRRRGDEMSRQNPPAIWSRVSTPRAAGGCARPSVGRHSDRREQGARSGARGMPVHM
jgi:hypothetical protein